ncbi:MAG: aminopeptidase P family protein, partial [Candidatus Gastranaerophilales bacterium]|nr:aminopeptidase P family protein [Candidatus Gastranaerophilales bacterium]
MTKLDKLRCEQIKYYTDLLDENSILLLKSTDEFYKCHYTGSPLNILTGFSGTAGEALIDSDGNITLFVDTRYHILADKQAYKDIKIVKMPLSETFFDAFKKNYKKGTKLFVYDDILLSDYLNYDSYFDLRKYKLSKNFTKNLDIDESKPLFEVSSSIEKNDFINKIDKYKKTNPTVERLLIFNPDIISYFTNLRSFKCLYSSNFKSVLYLDFNMQNHILFVENVNEIKNIKIDKLKIMPLAEYYDFINNIDSDIYINYKDITLDKFLSIKKPKQTKNDNLPLIVSIKPMSVIEHLKDSFSKLDNAIFNFKSKIKAGLSEWELAQIFDKELKSAGAIVPSFKTLLAIDENSASIHYSSYDKNKILKDESILLLDCGGYYEAGYATDITRTFYFGNNPKPIHKKIYTTVLKAFLTCYLSKNTNAKELDSMARKILSPFYDDGFNFNHGLGHGIGTSVHQNPPVLSNVSSDIIKPYQVHSIEPGLYGKSISQGVEFGIRIENCVYSDIEYNKISLSKFPFEEVLIDYSMLNIIEMET